MSNGKLAGALVGIFIIATIAGTWAAYSYSYEYAAVQSSAAAQFDSAALEPSSAPVPQTSNAGSKSDRLAAVVPAAVAVEIISKPETVPAIVARPEPTPASTSYSVAALTTTAIEPPKPRTEIRKPVAAPSEKAKRLEQQKLLLDDVQIASLRTRLRLTPTQEEFWPAVEVTLRNVVRQHARKFRSKSDTLGTPQIDVNSPEVQQLISAAVPLIMRLSEEQKHEVRTLARIIGLETVAAKI